jgi:hypothetical protein
MRRSRVWRATLAGLAVAGTMTMTAGPASADVPWDGALCQAAENIQFYTAPGGDPSYVVQANDYIRVVSAFDTYWAYGHGSGHSDRYFVWQHSNGVDRIYNCH